MRKEFRMYPFDLDNGRALIIYSEKNTMNKLLSASLLTLAVASQAEAACITLDNRYSGAIPANETVTAYGPVTIVNGPTCSSVVIRSQVQSAQGGPKPTMWIEKLENGQWRKVADAPGGAASLITGAGTYQIRHENEYPVPRVYSGNTTITR